MLPVVGLAVPIEPAGVNPIAQNLCDCATGNAPSAFTKNETGLPLQRTRFGLWRKLNLISLDDGYSAPKTVEQTRRLIEEERVAFIFQTFGGFTNLAIRPYLNENKVPQLFSAAGADQLDDPQNFPWTIGFNPATSTEGRIYAKHILATKPDAKIGVLYQNDQLGKTFLAGVRDALGAQHAGALVKEVSYEVAEPTVDSQVLTLQGAGVDALIIAATNKAAAQTIRKVYDIGWTPERYLFFGAASIAGTLKPAGLEKSKGLITAGYLKEIRLSQPGRTIPASKNGRPSRRNT
jgi:branched-chain amino acid transport system substrate-binding protein